MVAQRNADGLPVVVMGHLAVSGCDLSGHDPRLVGGMENLSVNKLGDDYDYFALGHIHRPQTLVDSHGRVRYSGSPLHVSFDENYPHTVSIVELEKHGATPIVREERIRQLMHTFTVPKEALPFEEALDELLHFQTDGSGYVRLNIKVKDYAPTNAETRIREALAGKSESTPTANARTIPIFGTTSSLKIKTSSLNVWPTPPLQCTTTSKGKSSISMS